MQPNILSLAPDILSRDISAQFPRYRAQQVVSWLYTKFETDPELMSNLPKDIKGWLRENYDLALPNVDLKLVSVDETIKYRLNLVDSKQVEMVVIPAPGKNTLCVSSQVGCGRGCDFCATAAMGFSRSLSVEEIVGQIVLASKSILPQRITNLVFMGMGEPMDNLDNVLSSLRIIQADPGMSFSPRRTTISTSGVVPGIYALADSGIKTKLAVSLNSAIEDKRNKLMPINRKHKLAELKQAVLYFRRKTNFRVTFEYILIPEFNMSYEDIRALSQFVGDISCKINFIPYNPVSGKDWKAPTENQISDFMQKAQLINQAVTLRKSRGSDISGACGQLVSKLTN